MHSTLFEIFGLPVRSYGFFLAIGFLLGLWRMKKIAPKYEFSYNAITDLAIYSLIAGVLGSRLLYVLSNLSSYSFKDVFAFWNGGLSFHGGIIAGIITAYIFARKNKYNFFNVLDILVPSVCIGYAFTRIGCFLNGCCYGVPSHMPWAVKMLTPHGLEMCQPVQLYASFISIVMFFILRSLEFKNPIPGFVFTWYILLYGLYRFGIEYLRYHESSDYVFTNITGGQVLSLIMIISAVTLLIIRFRKKEIKE